MHSAFGQYFVKQGHIEPQYSRMLINAFNVRLDSDYEAKPVFDEGLAQDVLGDADQFVKRIELHLRKGGIV